MENEQREGNTKKRLKKLWKKAKQGEINSAESYLECLASGVSGSPSLTFSADPGRGQADFDLQSSEVRSLLLSLLYDQQDQTPRVLWPPPLSPSVNVELIHRLATSYVNVSHYRASRTDSIDQSPECNDVVVHVL